MEQIGYGSSNAVHWFNPLVYVMRYRSNADIEMACDSELVEGRAQSLESSTVRRYCRLYIREGKERQYFPLFLRGSENHEREAGKHIDGGGKRGGIVALCLVVVAVIVIGALVACGGSTAAELTAEEKAQITELLDNFGRELTNVQ